MCGRRSSSETFSSCTGRRNREHEAVGKIKILSYVGEDYIKGEVLEGRVQTGDVAKKGWSLGLSSHRVNDANSICRTSETCKNIRRRPIVAYRFFRGEHLIT